MNKKIIISGIVILFLGVFIFNALSEVKPEKIENAPDWRTVTTAVDEAKSSDKLLLVDVYEVGCKYCRAMEREVYPDSTVRAVLDAGFVPVKVNGNGEDIIEFKGQQMTEAEFAKKYNVRAFPTTLILDADGRMLKKFTGYMNVDELRRFMYNPRS